MRIIVAHISLNIAGGGELVCLLLIKALRKKGHQVTLVTIERTDWAFLKKIFGDICFPDKEVYFLSSLPKMPAILQDLFLLMFYIVELLFLRVVKREKILVNMCGEKIDSIADLTYVNGMPLRCTYRLPVDAKKRCFGKLWNSLLKVFDKTYSALLIVNSNFVLNIVKETVRKRTFVIYPPVRLSKIDSAELNATRQNLVLNVCRFLPKQGLYKVPVIAKFVENAKFFIVGPSSIRSQSTLKNLNRAINQEGVKDKMRILENLAFSDYLKIFSRAKVFLRTLPHEPFGIAVVEAMAAGCVPVVLRSGGPWYDILDCKQGVYGFSYSSVEEAARIINRLLKDDNLREKVAERARKRALMFDSSVFERKILRIVEWCLNRKSVK